VPCAIAPSAHRDLLWGTPLDPRPLWPSPGPSISTLHKGAGYRAVVASARHARGVFDFFGQLPVATTIVVTNTVIQMAPRTKNLLARDTYIAVMRVHERLAAQSSALFKRHGLTLATYNVLRILRGAGTDGLPCNAVGERLVNRVPDVTRLLDRMERDGLVLRERGTQDRRVVRAFLTEEGHTRVDSLDQPVLDLHAMQFEDFGMRDLTALKTALQRLIATPLATD
jgi:DNA-binding MarR family transcriptional regulator